MHAVETVTWRALAEKTCKSAVQVTALGLINSQGKTGDVPTNVQFALKGGAVSVSTAASYFADHLGTWNWHEKIKSDPRVELELRQLSTWLLLLFPRLYQNMVCHMVAPPMSLCSVYIMQLGMLLTSTWP